MQKTYAGMALTVSELIAELEKYPADLPVFVEGKAAVHVYIYLDYLHIKPAKWGETCQEQDNSK